MASNQNRITLKLGVKNVASILSEQQHRVTLGCYRVLREVKMGMVATVLISKVVADSCLVVNLSSIGNQNKEIIIDQNEFNQSTEILQSSKTVAFTDKSGVLHKVNSKCKLIDAISMMGCGVYVMSTAELSGLCSDGVIGLRKVFTQKQLKQICSFIFGANQMMIDYQLSKVLEDIDRMLLFDETTDSAIEKRSKLTEHIKTVKRSLNKSNGVSCTSQPQPNSVEMKTESKNDNNSNNSNNSNHSNGISNTGSNWYSGSATEYSNNLRKAGSANRTKNAQKTTDKIEKQTQDRIERMKRKRKYPDCDPSVNANNNGSFSMDIGNHAQYYSNSRDMNNDRNKKHSNNSHNNNTTHTTNSNNTNDLTYSQDITGVIDTKHPKVQEEEEEEDNDIYLQQALHNSMNDSIISESSNIDNFGVLTIAELEELQLKQAMRESEKQSEKDKQLEGQ